MRFYQEKGLALYDRKKYIKTLWIMGNLLESLKDYFENTPKDVLEKKWKEIEYLNEIGPDVIEYTAYVKEQFGTEISYSFNETNREAHIFEVSDCCNNSSIRADSHYYYAA